ncbi:MAG: acyl-CoA thioesterase [Pseudomonadota bacterium]
MSSKEVSSNTDITALRKLVREEHFSVRWGEMDALGHVNNVVYFRYFESIRVNWLRDCLGGVLHSHEQGPVLVHTDCQFIKPILYPSECSISLYCRQPGRSSLVNEYEIWAANAGESKQLATRATSTLVWVDFEKQSSLPLPAGLREFKELEAKTEQ